MIVNKTLAMLVLAATLGSTAATAHSTVKPNAESFQTALTSAEAARQKAASVDGEWRDTGKIIKAAKAAAKKGDYAKAIELADRARFQGEMGYRQAMEQKNAGLPAYLTK